MPLLLLFILAPALTVQQQTPQKLDQIQGSASEQAKTLVRLFNMTDDLVVDQVESACVDY